MGGLGTSVLVFAFSTSVVLEAFDIIASSTVNPMGSGIGLRAVGRMAIVVWFGVGLSVLLVGNGVYGFFYWVQQLRRLPRYVEYWEKYWKGRSRNPQRTSVTRPPGLFLPFQVMWMPVVLLLSLVGNDGLLESQVALTVFGISWPVVFALSTWSAWSAFRRRPQSLHHEGRDVCVALFVQVPGFAVAWMSVVDIRPVVVGLLSVAMLTAYVPDVKAYSDRHVGTVSYIYVVFVGFLFAITLTLGSIIGGPVPIWVWGLVGVLLGLSLLYETVY